MSYISGKIRIFELICQAKHLLVVMLVLNLPAISMAQQGEYKIKAAFLEKFTRFIEWPESSNMSDKSKPFIISVI